MIRTQTLFRTIPALGVLFIAACNGSADSEPQRPPPAAAETETSNRPAGPPPGSPACPAGTGGGLAEIIGEGGGTIEIGPPVSRRTADVVIEPSPGAQEEVFYLVETAAEYPEVEANDPAGRTIVVDIKKGPGCGPHNGTLAVYRWNGTDWERQANIVEVTDSSAAVRVTSASRFALGTE